MDSRRLFEENLTLIDRLIGRVCAKAGIAGADAEDFASDVCVALLDNDCAILREWEGRASLATYLIVVVQRMLADARRQIAGKWKPSAEARRLGDAAVALERLVRRQGRTLEEALPAMRAIDPSMTIDQARAIAGRLPERAPRPRLVPLDPETDVPSRRDHADATAIASDERRLAGRTGEIVRRTLESLSDEDQMIVRFRYASSMTIADISRILRLPQRPLYRRIESILGNLRSELRDAGIDPRALDELVGSSSAADFDFWKNVTAVPATETTAGERRP